MNRVDRILLIKMDHLGDALWAFPAVKSLRTLFPQANIDMLCTPYLAEAFHTLPALSSVFEYDVKSSLLARIKLLLSLRQNHYDYAITLGPVDKINHLAYFSGARERLGYAYTGNPLRAISSRIFLTDRISHPADEAERDNLPLPHEVEAMHMLTSKLKTTVLSEKSFIVEDLELFFPLPSSEEDWGKNTLAHVLPEYQQYAAIHLCAKSFPFGWNPAFLSKLVLQLRLHFPTLGWFVTAGPSERSFLEPFQSILSEMRVPLLTELTLLQTGALLKIAQCLISWDTGLVHLSTALRTPTIAIFPPQHYEYCVQRWGPKRPGLALRQSECPAGGSILADILAAVKAQTVLTLSQ